MCQYFQMIKKYTLKNYNIHLIFECFFFFVLLLFRIFKLLQIFWIISRDIATAASTYLIWKKVPWVMLLEWAWISAILFSYAKPHFDPSYCSQNRLHYFLDYIEGFFFVRKSYGSFIPCLQILYPVHTNQVTQICFVMSYRIIKLKKCYNRLSRQRKFLHRMIGSHMFDILFRSLLVNIDE